LPEQAKRTAYMQKIYRKIRIKTQAEAKLPGFNDAFSLAEAVGQAVERTGNDYTSISAAIRHLFETETWLIKYFNLNQKHLTKMYDHFKVSDIQFRSRRFASTIIKCLDEEVACYNYRKENDGSVE